MKQDISDEDWEYWIEESLMEQLENDFKNCNIISEGDLQSSVAFFLRNEVSKLDNRDWKILNMPTQKTNESFIRPDLLLTYKSKRKIAIELKQSVCRKVQFKIIEDGKLTGGVLADIYKLGRYSQDSEITTYLIWTCCVADRKKFTKQVNALESAAKTFANRPRVVVFDLVEKLENYLETLDLIEKMKEEISKFKELKING